MPDAPERPRRYQHFVLIVAIDFAFDADIGCCEPRGPRRWPVAVYPAAVDLDLENGRKQTRERPIETVIDGVASGDRMIERRKIRHNGLVRNGRIVEREGADEEAITGNAVRMRPRPCEGSNHRCDNDPL